jgi:PAS domain S-box-containing protein
MPAPRILVVEDEAVTATDLDSLLGRFGYEVVGVAASGDQALALARQIAPDLVLMDVRLRGPMDGVDTALRLTADSDVAVVFLTAHADDETLKRATISAPLGYVLKPFGEREIRAAIEIALYRQRMERRLRESERRYRMLFEQSLAAIFVADDDGTLRDGNAALATLLGLRGDDLVGRRLPDFLVEPAEWARLAVGLRSVASVSNLDVRIRAASGVARWTLVNAARIGDDTGARIEGQILDISDRKHAEAAIRTHQALRGVVALARTMAHEIFNPLTPLLGHLRLLQQQLGPAAGGRHVEAAIASALRIREIVDRMANVTRLEYDPKSQHVGEIFDLRRSDADPVADDDRTS